MDRANCFDRIAHAIASLTLTTASMIQTIQEMEFFLQAPYGDSCKSLKDTIKVTTERLCQGNGVSPATWAVISIVVI